MDILIQAAQFILSLSLLIILHEFGHFIPAKLFKTKVEKFYLFFDPWFSLVKKKIGETEYGIGWLPLGGYVKIAGMVDESMDKEQLKQEPQPWEFRVKPAWQRLIIMIGGVTVNILLAFIIYAGMLMYYGERYLPVENASYGIKVDSLAYDLGLRDGDRILAVDGQEIDRFSAIPKEIILSERGEIDLMRNGRRLSLNIDAKDKEAPIAQGSRLVEPLIPFVVDSILPGTPAETIGLRPGDSLVGLNDQSIYTLNEFGPALRDFREDSVNISFYRGSEKITRQTYIGEDAKIGVAVRTDFLQYEFHKYGFWEAWPAGVKKSVSVLTDYIRQFNLIFDSETGAYKQVGGFITIGKQFDTQWNWQSFWNFTAFLSIMLAFLNILPIPALDGGHVVFVLWEMITGRKPSEKVLEYAQMIGFFLLLALIILANGNDILRVFTGS